MSDISATIPATKHPRALGEMLRRNFDLIDPQPELTIMQLGRYGDIINMLPIVQGAAAAGVAVTVAVAREFSDLFDGISYCSCLPLDLKFTEYARGIVECQKLGRPLAVSQIWGEGCKKERRCASYNRESWDAAGVEPCFDWSELTPTFDRRNGPREAELLKQLGYRQRPFIAISVTSGVSSPFIFGEQIFAQINARYGNEFDILNLCGIWGERLFDFLGVMEKAALLITADTSFLHLSCATRTPTVALINQTPGVPWGTPELRGKNIELAVGYLEVEGRTPEIFSTIDRVLSRATKFSNLELHANG